jgi:hypothetical protein
LVGGVCVWLCSEPFEGDRGGAELEQRCVALARSVAAGNDCVKKKHLFTRAAQEWCRDWSSLALGL